MKKYLLVARLTWDETFSYRLNFTMWRVRTIIQLLTMYFLWLAIIPENGNILGYSRTFMLTYILGTSLISSIIIASRSYEVGTEINNGNLSNFLIRPINYFMYWFARDIGDKGMNITFSIIELFLLFLILKPPIFLQTEISFLLLAALSAGLGLLMYFFISFLLGMIGFWSPEVWAPRFIFLTVLTFFSGGLFPLDILPKPIFSFFELLPFPYLLYFPLKIYLGQLPLIEIYKGLAVSCVWIGILYALAKFVWIKGLKLYTAYGR